MSRVYTPVEITEFALQNCGTYSVHDTGADPDEMHRGLHYLDMLVAQVTGTMRCWWLIPATVAIPLAADTNPTDILAAAEDDIDSDTKAQFIVAAKLRKVGTDDERPLPFIDRREYEAIDDKKTSGIPEKVYIDRTKEQPMLYTHPVTDEADTWEVLLTYQRYSEDLTDKAIQDVGFEPAWNRYLVKQLTVDLGSGPIVRLPESEIDRHQGQADEALERLRNFNGREQKPYRRTAYRDF